TYDQAIAVTSYIRSNPTPTVGRPWDPPYQPGPGLDASIREKWAGGAGRTALLARDRDTLDRMFPTLASGPGVDFSATLNLREMPIQLPLPDWNQWLPRVHPRDAWGAAAFDTNTLTTGYASLKNSLASGYRGSNLINLVNAWSLARYNFLVPRTEGALKPSPWTTEHSMSVYSTAQWQLVKLWDLMQTYDLEGLPRSLLGPQAEVRGWFGNGIAFQTSPNMLKIPESTLGIKGNALGTLYLSNAWYHVQAILNSGHRKAASTGAMDWGYTFGKIKDALWKGQRHGSRLLALIYKACQERTNGKPPSVMVDGWEPSRDACIKLMVQSDYSGIWKDVTASEKTALCNGFLAAWIAECKKWTPQQYYSAGLAAASEVPVSNFDGRLCDRVWAMIPGFRSAGADPAVLADVKAWAATVWPAANWGAR
ncbi:MAG TPA: hypothetical protein VIM84_05210, partial [Gemmatimonadales bacterium]